MRIHSIALCVLAFVCCNAYAEQARRYVLMEHFTQASCGPCAYFNPGFERGVVQRNPGVVHHIAYHTSWPGTDPMYDYNTAENNFRTSTYSVSGVPHVIVLGDYTSAGMYEGSQEMIDSLEAAGSPLAVLVDEAEHNGKRTVAVRLKGAGAMPDGEHYRLFVAIVEDLVEYPEPPGSNGERLFPNVFRKMLPSAQGVQVPIPAVGESAVYTFEYAIDSTAWKPDRIYAIAFVQNTSTLEILNSGSSRDLQADLVAPVRYRVAESTPVEFALSASNAAVHERLFRVRLSSSAPASWNTALSTNGVPIVDDTPFAIGAGQQLALQLSVVPSSAPGVGRYTVELLSVEQPELPAVARTLYVVHRVTDLVVSNDERWNDAYTAPLSIGKAGVGVVDAYGFGSSGNIWSSVQSIYYNAGWNFPALTDPVVAMLARFVDRGGNLLVAGQDIGWDQVGFGTKVIDDSTAVEPAGTPATRKFWDEYLQAGMYSDGAGMRSLVAENSDAVFGGIGNTSLQDVHPLLLPDVLVPMGDAVPVLVYGENKDNIAGVRYKRGDSRIVYLGFGLEMLEDAVRVRMLSAVQQWFEGITSDVEFNSAVQSAVCYPNPACEMLTVSVPASGQTRRLVVSTLYGALVLSLHVAPGESAVAVPVHSLVPGFYSYRIAEGTKFEQCGVFQVGR